MPKYQLHCAVCDREFIAGRSIDQPVPKYCSNACKGKAYEISKLGSLNPMYGMTGKLCPSYGMKRTASARKAMSDAKKGKKYPKMSEARRGTKATDETRKKQSIGQKRSIKNGRKIGGYIKKQFVQGYYKGAYFRSSYEFAFIVMMESKGHTLGDDLLYEHVRIPYTFDGTEHVYVSDFFSVKDATVFEIKHTRELCDAQVIAKFDAAKSYCASVGYKFVVMTEHDVGSLLTRDQIKAYPGIELCS